jgi:protein-S-isoprenylcysteine O-methyltransferase Ste14
VAKGLNQTRGRDTKIILGICFFTTIFTRPLFPLETALHEGFDLIGGMLVAMCVVGRIYCTTFLGGHKNQTLITIGPFSLCRNPLYFCSFLGIVGIAMMSNHLVLLVLIPTLFLVIYGALIRREEVSLQQMFGHKYAEYCRETPRFWPRISRFSLPDSLLIKPKLLTNAVLDGLLWFLALPVFEFIEYAQRAGFIRTWSLLF